MTVSDFLRQGEVHIGAALRKLQNQPFMVRAGQQIGVQQLDLPLSVPKLGQVGHLMAPPPLFAGNQCLQFEL